MSGYENEQRSVAAEVLEDGTITGIIPPAEVAGDDGGGDDHEPKITDTEADNLFRLLEDVNQLRQEETEIHAEHQRVIKQRKEAQLSLEKYLKELQTGVTAGPLFDQAQGEQVQSVESEAWRTVPIREALLGLQPKVYQSLEEADIRTMGEYSDYCKAHGDFSNPLEQVKGLGPKKAEAVQEAESAFWARQKQATDIVETVAEALGEQEPTIDDQAQASAQEGD